MPRIPEAHADLFRRFARGPTLVREALDGVDPATLNRRPPGEDWSMRDIVIHLADAELMHALRLRLALAGGDAALPTWDADLWKRRLLYVFRDAEAALSALQQVRYSAAELLRECAPDAWERSARDPLRGDLTVADLLADATTHLERHATQLRARRA